jgi:hypothetical protein
MAAKNRKENFHSNNVQIGLRKISKPVISTKKNRTNRTNGSRANMRTVVTANGLDTGS